VSAGAEVSQAVNAVREVVTDKETGLRVLGHWREFARDVWFARVGAGGLKHAQFQVEYKELANLDPFFLARLGQLVTLAETEIAGHCDLQLTFENLVYQLRGLA
jgi:hypothetical protein